MFLAFHSLTPSFTPRKFPWHSSIRTTCGGMLLGALGSAGAHEPTAPFERLALRALYESAGGASWGAKGNARWMTGDPCGVPPYYCGQNCEGWAGVHCWGPGGHVRRLEVRHTVGVLPTELGLLTSLAALELPGNRLSGTLPSELGRIPFRRTAADVAALILGGHKLSGTIPLEVALGLPDHLSRCTLPRHLECSPGGVFPPACSRKPTATDGKAACSSHGTAVPVARLCPVPPSRELATTSIGQLCEALAHLGHSHLLPLGSTAEVALRAGFRSVTQFVSGRSRACTRSPRRPSPLFHRSPNSSTLRRPPSRRQCSWPSEACSMGATPVVAHLAEGAVLGAHEALAPMSCQDSQRRRHGWTSGSWQSMSTAYSRRGGRCASRLPSSVLGRVRAVRPFHS